MMDSRKKWKLGLTASQAGWGAVVLALTILFVLWPYSSWAFKKRTSLLPGLMWTVRTDSEWFFCMFIPFVVAYLIWKKRDRLRDLPLQGEPWGLLVAVVGGVFYWIGYKVDTSYPGYLAAHLISAGFILAVGGRQWMRGLLFPWLFLAFTWPMYPLEDRISFPLRMAMAKASGVLINLLGVNVVREGTAIYSAADPVASLAQGAKFMLDVDAPCAGMRSLFALIVISVIYAYIALKSFRHRLILVLCAFPLAVAGNMARMVMLALGSTWWGVEVAVGRTIDGHQEISAFHEGAGYAVFAVALGGMFALAGFLEGWKKKKVKSATRPEPTEELNGKSSLGRAITGVAGITALTLLLCSAMGQPAPLGELGVGDTLPLNVGKTQGWKGEMDQKEKNLLADDVLVLRNHYIMPTGASVTCSVVQSGTVRRSLHRPEICLPAQGWNVLDKIIMPVTLTDGRTVDCVMVRMLRDYIDESGAKKRIRALNMFLYIGSEAVTTPDYYDHVFLTYLHSLTRNVNHRWSLVSFFMPFAQTDLGTENIIEEVGAVEDLQSFVGEMIPLIMKKAE